MTFKQCKAQLVQLYGGREAERIIFGEDDITTGATGDIKAATELARRMIEEFGMSKKLGQVDLGNRELLSSSTVREIDIEIRRLTQEAQEKANCILSGHRVELDAIAEALLSRETLSGSEIRDTAANARPSHHL